MRDFAFAQKDPDKIRFFRFQDKRELEPETQVEGLLMSRPDFTIKTTMIPPIQPAEIRNMLSYRLRSLYPGDPEQTVFDYKILAKGKERHAVLFITTKEIIDEYRVFAGKSNLLLPFTLIRPYFRKFDNKQKIFLFWHPKWIDISIVEEDILTSTTAVKREVDPEFDLHKIQNVLPQNLEEYQIVFMSFLDELDTLKIMARTHFKNADTMQFISVEEATALLTPKSDYLFRKQDNSAFTLFYNKLRADILLIPLILLSLLLFNKFVLYRADYRTKLKQVYNTTIDLTQRKAYYNQKLSDLNELEKKKPRDLFRLFSELTGIFDRETVIVSFRYEKDSMFTVECIGMEPLNYMKKFEENKFFENVKLRESVKVDGSNKEQFKLTGRLNVDG